MRSSTFDLFWLTALVAGVVYFSVDGWASRTGDNGVAALQNQIRSEQARLVALEAERNALRLKAQNLTGPEIDADLLDETIRAVFGVGRADEQLIKTPERF